MRIPSGVTDQYIYFVAVDATDLKTRKTALATWTVYRSRDGAAAAAFNAPTINETDVTNMPGVYELLLDEDMTIAAGNDSEEVCLHITHAGMAPVTRVFELYRPKFTAGATLAVTDIVSAGAITTLSGAVVNVDLVDVLTTYTGNTVQTGDSFARLGAPAAASVSADILAIDNFVDGLEATIGAAGAGLTAVPWNAAWDAEVESEVNDALVVQRLDELLNADSDIDGAAPPTVGSVFHELLTKTAGSFTYDQTTDSLEAVRDRGDANWITATGFATSGQATAIQADTDDIQTRLPAALVAGRIDASVGAMAAGTITAAAIATDAIDADALAADAGTEIGTAVWATAARTVTAATNITSTGAAVPITAGGLVSADVTAISTDTTAADNAEAMFDGAGYAGGTIKLTVDAVAISGDTTAADNAELFFDGTGYNAANSTVGTVAAVTTLNGIAANVITASALATSAVDEIVDAVWDEVLTGATHNVANSAGKRLRQIDAAFEVHSGTAAAGAAGTITLDGAASATSNIYNGDRIVITDGTGAGEHGIIVSYDGGTKVATMSKNWVVTPDNTSVFEVVPADVDVEAWNNAAATGDGDWAELQTDVDSILDDTGTSGVVVAAGSKTGYSLSAAGITAIWAEVMTGTTTAVQAVRGFIAAMLGKASGLPTAPVYRNIADSKNVITATTDTDGNRTAVTLDLT